MHRCRAPRCESRPSTTLCVGVGDVNESRRKVGGDHVMAGLGHQSSHARGVFGKQVGPRPSRRCDIDQETDLHVGQMRMCCACSCLSSASQSGYRLHRAASSTTAACRGWSCADRPSLAATPPRWCAFFCSFRRADEHARKIPVFECRRWSAVDPVGSFAHATGVLVYC